MTRYVILGLLRDGRARHGYALMKEFRSAAGVALSLGNVYRELRALVLLGWVRVGTRPPGTDVRRIVYEATPAGQAAVDRWLMTPLEPWARVDELSLRVMLLGKAGSLLPADVLDRWREELGFLEQHLRRERERVVPPGPHVVDECAAAVAAVRDRRRKWLELDLELVEALRRDGAGARPVVSNGSPVPGRRHGAAEEVTGRRSTPLPPPVRRRSAAPAADRVSQR